MANIRTIINRGEELDQKKIKSGIYAVHYDIGSVTNENYRPREQWGIVVMKDGLVTRTYNVSKHNVWCIGEIPDTFEHRLRYFNSSVMEKNFVYDAITCENEHRRAEDLRKKYEEELVTRKQTAFVLRCYEAELEHPIMKFAYKLLCLVDRKRRCL